MVRMQKNLQKNKDSSSTDLHSKEMTSMMSNLDSSN